MTRVITMEKLHKAEDGFEVRLSIHKDEHLFIEIFKHGLHVATLDFDRLTTCDIIDSLQDDVEANTDVARNEGYNKGYDKGFDQGFREGWSRPAAHEY